MGSFRWVLQKVAQRARSHWIKTGKGTEAEETACVEAQRSKTALQAGRA